MLIVIDERPDGTWATNLTDQETVTRRKKHATAARALTEVGRLLGEGHTPAFRSALRDLTTAAIDATAPPRATRVLALV